MAETHTKDGFRIRGAEMTRLETFVDAAFAFAVTLLVVGGDSIPANYGELVLAMQQLPASALCFGNIAFFWYAHYAWSRRYGLEDARSTILSLILIFLVLAFVFPLKAVYSGAFLFVPGIDPESAFTFSSVGDFGVMLVIFGMAFSSLSSIIVLLNWHALWVADTIGLSPTERFDTVTTIHLWLVNALLPLGSVAIALFASGLWLIAAAVYYIVFGAVMPIVSVQRQRQRRVLFPEPDPEG
jgi:uncharacterized membrane protein